MALWDNSAINTNETAMVNNQVYNRKAIDQVSKKKGLLEAVLGIASPNTEPGKPAFERERKISGDKVETRLLGKYKTIGTLADGSAEVASRTGVYTDGIWGAATFDLTHYNDQDNIPRHELDRYKGQEAKTASYLGERLDYLIGSWYDTLAIAISGEDDQSRTSLGGWAFAIDGTNTYGGIDRSADGNVDFKGHENTSFSSFTLDKLSNEYTTVKTNGGNPNILIGAATVYDIMVKVLRDEGTLQHTYGSSGNVAAGGSSFSWMGMELVLDPNVTASTLGMLDSRTWTMWMSEQLPFSGVMPDPLAKSAYYVNLDAWAGFICHFPKGNGKFENMAE